MGSRTQQARGPCHLDSSVLTLVPSPDTILTMASASDPQQPGPNFTEGLGHSAPQFPWDKSHHFAVLPSALGIKAPDLQRSSVLPSATLVMKVIPFREVCWTPTSSLTNILSRPTIVPPQCPSQQSVCLAAQLLEFPGSPEPESQHREREMLGPSPTLKTLETSSRDPAACFLNSRALPALAAEASLSCLYMDIG